MTDADPLETISAWQQMIRDSDRVVVCGAGTKVHSPVEKAATLIDSRLLHGIIEYDPSEFTFTAWAGTPLAEIEARLAAEGQYMPFDPPLAADGATLAGTVASGLNGACRLAHGGIRDFILGIRFVDGRGDVVRAGGRVVKNSAGFDLPKFFVGSTGSFGALTELTFKVFPKPPSFATLTYQWDSLTEATRVVTRLRATAMRMDAIELEPPCRMLIRFGGEPAALDSQTRRLRTMIGRMESESRGPDEEAVWQSSRRYDWCGANLDLIKVPVTLADVARLEESLVGLRLMHRYGAAFHVAWIASSPPQLAEIDEALLQQGLTGRIVRGTETNRWLGAVPSLDFARRVKSALDPDGKFPPLRNAC